MRIFYYMSILFHINKKKSFFLKLDFVFFFKARFDSEIMMKTKITRLKLSSRMENSGDFPHPR